MPVSLYLPDALHRRLAQKAAHHGMSLHQYTVRVLAEHCELPTMAEWLAEVADLAPARPKISAAQTIVRSRKADDRRLARWSSLPPVRPL